jgi:F0F1-type ATP synthase assembly protein I
LGDDVNKGTGDYRRYIGLGFQLPGAILLGVLLGWWADGWFGTKPWLLIGGAALGMVAGFTSFILTVLKAEREAAEHGNGDEKS